MKGVRTLLISTYDLGRQPLGLASPAAWLRQAGVEVECVDTSRDRLTDEHIRRGDLVGFFLPMHTATRLAAPLIARVRALNPGARIAAYGLYAPLNASWLRAQGVTDVLAPDGEAELLAIAIGNSQLPTPNSQLPTSNSQLPIPNSQLPTPNSQLPIPKTGGHLPEAAIRAARPLG